MKDTAVWLLSLAAGLILGSAAIGVLLGISWRAASWVAG